MMNTVLLLLISGWIYLIKEYVFKKIGLCFCYRRGKRCHLKKKKNSKQNFVRSGLKKIATNFETRICLFRTKVRKEKEGIVRKLNGN